MPVTRGRPAGGRGGQVVGQQLRFVVRGEVAAARHDRVPGETVGALDPASGKVKRLLNNSRVELRPCGRTGKVDPGARVVTGHAVVLDDRAAHDRVAAVVRRKYALEYFLVMGVERLTRRGSTRVGLRITPSA